MRPTKIIPNTELLSKELSLGLTFNILGKNKAMPRQLPPIDKRFPVNRPYAPHKGKHGPQLVALLRKLISKKIKYEDPETQKIIKGRVKDAILWRLILNATQGDNQAIIHILDRIDGKVTEVIREEKDQSALLNDEIELIPSDGNGKISRIQEYLKKNDIA